MRSLCIVKVGGSLVDSNDAVRVLAKEIHLLAETQQVVVVHGGGPQATRLATRLGHQPVIVEGRRVTSSLDLEIIEATVCGVVNSQLVAALVGVGVNAVGISGAAAGSVIVKKRPPWQIEGRVVDFGHVGDIQSVDPSLVEALLGGGYVPVVATIGIDDAGNLYNVNADTTAAALATALRADRFCIVTDSGGLHKEGLLIDACDAALYRSGKAEHWITGGMQVKLKAGFMALDSGVEHVEIVGYEGIVEGNGTRLIRTQKAVEAS